MALDFLYQAERGESEKPKISSNDQLLTEILSQTPPEKHLYFLSNLSHIKIMLDFSH